MEVSDRLLSHDIYNCAPTVLFSQSQGSRPYPSDIAKRQIDILSGWMGGFENHSYDVMLK